MPIDQTPYRAHGFSCREEYLRNLAEEYGCDMCSVFALASLFGPNEDFDGLVSALADGQADTHIHIGD